VSRRVVTAGVIVAVIALFTWEWAAAPRVKANPALEKKLAQARGAQYLGLRFEGLPLRTVQPFLYSDCIPGKPHVVKCQWVKVAGGRVTGSDPRQVRRATTKLRPVD
jgi:hypothetical protein